MLNEINVRSIVLNKMIWIYAEDVYSGLNIDKESALKMIDEEDLINHEGVDMISEWALLAIDVQLKKEGIERKFVLL